MTATINAERKASLIPCAAEPVEPRYPRVHAAQDGATCTLCGEEVGRRLGTSSYARMRERGLTKKLAREGWRFCRACIGAARYLT
jgi:hypothetical protein